jgi:hypothetical protein
MDQQAIAQRLWTWTEETPRRIFLRRDFAHLGSARQLSRALAVLLDEKFIARTGTASTCVRT